MNGNAESLLQRIQKVEVQPSLSAYLELSNSAETEEGRKLPSYRVALLSNFTTDTLLPVLSGELLRSGFHPCFYQGGFDSIASETLDPDSALYRFGPDLILILNWLESEGESLTPGTQFLNSLPSFLAAIRQHTRAAVLVNNFPALYRALSGENETLHVLNASLKKTVKEHEKVFLLNLFGVFSRLGTEQSYDSRFWRMARAPLAQKALVSTGREIGNFVRASEGKVKKCLVLDCDGVLWGGILGEDGPQQIKLGNEYPGNCYLAFQKTVLALKGQGVLLALCSKNNAADVLQLLKSHPHSLLKETDFASIQVNWDDKATNLRRIARDLNIAIDALVFLDDQPFERELVRSLLPDVCVLELPTAPSRYCETLLESGVFDRLEVTEEDKRKTEHFLAEKERKSLKDTLSLEAYLEALQMEVGVRRAEASDLPRLSQLTQKTNQFNLTTKRYLAEDLELFLQDPDHLLFCVSVKDRLGDLGTVGVAILKKEQETVVIDTFLLSCRALGRKVEAEFLERVLQEMQGAWKTREVLGHYRKTAKNEQVKDFFLKNGFRCENESEEGATWKKTIILN